MKHKPTLISDFRTYFGGLSAILFIGALYLLANGKTESFMLLNNYHPFYLNVFFINYTFIGDGIFALCLIAFTVFYLKKRKAGLAMLCCFLTSGLVVQVIKNLVYSPRPKLFFEAGQYLNFIENVTLSGHSSFPSGHTATAFAMATVLVLLIKNKRLQLPVLMAATLVGYSRIYLAQHFLLDVLIGAGIGSACGLLSYYMVREYRTIILFFKKINFLQTKNRNSESNVQTV
jgi:membrane-associated phospholipid phosphatase